MPQSRDPSLPPVLTIFIEPLLKVLGRKVNFKPGVFVNRKEVIHDAIREAGFDPDNLAQYGDPDKGWKFSGQKPMGFQRRVWLAHRKCYDQGKGWLPKGQVPLTLKGKKRGYLALTEAGAEKAKALCGTTEDDTGGSGGNLTADFLNKRLTDTGGLDGTLYSLMKAAVRVKLPLSATIGIVDDHIQTCFMKLIQRDALRERILRGKNITDSHLATYAVRSGFTDIRRDGTEPVCREMYGAQTERERAKLREERARRQEENKDLYEARPSTSIASGRRVTWDKDDKDWKTIADVEDTQAVDGDEAMAKRAFDDLWERIEVVVRYKKPNAWKRYMTILRMVSNGWSVKEIAHAEGVSRNRAATLVAQARKCVREGRNSDMLAAVL